jgi:hypothetical protein
MHHNDKENVPLGKKWFAVYARKRNYPFLSLYLYPMLLMEVAGLATSLPRISEIRRSVKNAVRSTLRAKGHPEAVSVAVAGCTGADSGHSTERQSWTQLSA